jgi:hypothetical protein
MFFILEFSLVERKELEPLAEICKVCWNGSERVSRVSLSFYFCKVCWNGSERVSRVSLSFSTHEGLLFSTHYPIRLRVLFAWSRAWG